MTIDELLQIFDDFNKIKPRIVKLEERKLRALETINQNVFIRDLVVRTAYPNCYGESRRHTNTHSGSTEIRLRAHIAMLFDLANEDHRANHCELKLDGTYEIQAGKKNHITRLSMPEFSLYSKHPMSMAEYTKLYEEIHNCDLPLDPNVQVLLSSFAVISEKGKLLNLSLLVQGGNPPTLHSFAKNIANEVDVDYGSQSQLFSQHHVITSTKNKLPIGSKTGEGILGEHGDIIYTGSVAEIETVGGARYTQTVDVCVDHAIGHSKTQIERRILGNARENEIIPEQVEQCVTSNSFPIFPDNIISDRVLHADSKRSMLIPYKRTPYDYQVLQGKRVLSDKAIAKVIPLGYSTDIFRSSLGYIIVEPPFGSDCEVELIAERPAGQYLPILQEAVKTHNKDVLATQLVAARQRELSADEKVVHKMVQSGSIKVSLFFRLEQLEHRLLGCCQPMFLQSYFETDELRDEFEAKKIIEEELHVMRKLVNSHGDDSLFMIRSWKNDLEDKLSYVGSTPTNSVLKRALFAEIRQALDVDLKSDLNCSFEEATDEEQKPRP